MLKPGESTTLKTSYLMGPGMGGPHHFQFTIKTNDPAQESLVFDLLANSIETKQ